MGDGLVGGIQLTPPLFLDSGSFSPAQRPSILSVWGYNETSLLKVTQKPKTVINFYFIGANRDSFWFVGAQPNFCFSLGSWHFILFCVGVCFGQCSEAREGANLSLAPEKSVQDGQLGGWGVATERPTCKAGNDAVVGQWFSNGGDFAPRREHLAMAGDVFLLSQLELGRLLHVLPCPGPSPQQKMILPQMSIALEKGTPDHSLCGILCLVLRLILQYKSCRFGARPVRVATFCGLPEMGSNKILREGQKLLNPEERGLRRQGGVFCSFRDWTESHRERDFGLNEEAISNDQSYREWNRLPCEVMSSLLLK